MTYATQARLDEILGEMTVVSESIKFLEMRSALNIHEQTALDQLRVRYEVLYAMSRGIGLILRGY